MGYSCTKRADDTLREITERFRFQNTGNTLRIGNRAPIFYEIGREQPDGAITGTVRAFCDEHGDTKAFLNSPIAAIEEPQNQYAKPIGGFRINADGVVARFPGLPRKYWPKPETFLGLES